ncbi:TDT family transporter [Marinobacterium sedimentorum]|uniref:TDT family transporter n=1 Tax=Marinobacterium sedimentorum TaxID=2927804 RepID=UPI0020C60E1A|nr:TDT family transporter [Marinobacterium sedimentorum]MCP8689768.1 TDT family transporter [Marinobacterium sedimentorum]
MFNAFRIATRQVPTPLAGLALAIAALGACWELYNPHQGQAQLTGALLASVLLLAILCKFVLNPLLLWRDLAHPVVGGVVPTFSMATMVISDALHPLVPTFAGGIWLLAVALHLTFLLLFALHRIRKFELHHMAPSWFVPPVGIVSAALTCPPEAVELARNLMWFGLISYSLLLPLMLYRLIFAKRLPRAARPILAILAAPANLCLAGYISIIDEPSILLIAVLGTVAQLMTLIIYMAFFQLVRLPFSASHAAFAFPVVVSALAMLELTHVLQTLGAPADVVGQIDALAKAQLGLASLMVLYVSGRLLLQYATSIRATAAQPTGTD